MPKTPRGTQTVIPTDSRPRSAELIRKYHYFVSYSSHEESDAAAITRQLQELGLRIYCDRDRGEFDRAPRPVGDRRGRRIPGDEYEVGNELWTELSHSLALLIIATEHSYRSHWVAAEIRHFREQQRPILVWHPAGDFWNAPQYDATFSVTRQEYDEIAGVVEVPWILQHVPEPRDQIEAVVARLHLWLELMEFAEWAGILLTCDGVESQASVHSAWCMRYETLQRQHETRFGQRLKVIREPHQFTDGMPVRRKGRHPPWRVKSVRLLERKLGVPSGEPRDPMGEVL